MAERVFENRIRFNWGYWDGAAEHKRGQENRVLAGHYDVTYRTGYLYGYADASKGNVGETSEAAWVEAVNFGDVQP